MAGCSSPPRVSDHALIRYIERVHGMNLDPLRKEITDIVAQGAKIGARTVVKDGFIYALKNGDGGVPVVASIFTPEMRNETRANLIPFKGQKGHRS